MDVEFDNLEFAGAALTGFKKLVDETTASLERLEAALERCDAKLAKFAPVLKVGQTRRLK